MLPVAVLTSASRCPFCDTMFSQAIKTKLFLLHNIQSCGTVRYFLTFRTVMILFTKCTSRSTCKFLRVTFHVFAGIRVRHLLTLVPIWKNAVALWSSHPGACRTFRCRSLKCWSPCWSHVSGHVAASRCSRLRGRDFVVCLPATFLIRLELIGSRTCHDAVQATRVPGCMIPFYHKMLVNWRRTMTVLAILTTPALLRELSCSFARIFHVRAPQRACSSHWWARILPLS